MERSFFKFVLVGILNTIISYTVYFLLIRLSVSFVIASAVGQICGIINSYFMNKNFTFGSKEKSIWEVVRFLLVYLFQYIFNVVFIYLVPFSYEVTGLIVLPINPIISFLGHKYFTFRNKNKSAK